MRLASLRISTAQALSLTLLVALSILSAGAARAVSANSVQCPFVPDGYFYLISDASAGFETFDYIKMSVGINWSKPVSESSVSTRNGDSYKFIKLGRFQTHPNGGGITFDFETDTVAGVKYAFTGKFHSVCILADDERDPTKMVAEGRLTKLQLGKEPMTVDIQFTYSKSPRKRHAHFVRQQADEVLSPEESRRAIAARARQVLMTLKARNMAKFSSFVHPQKGVRFSPYASVLPDEDRLVKRNQLVQMWASQKRYKWGGYDGSGDPIWLTFKKYYQRFIFDHDFSRAKDIAYNPGSMSHGNTPNTIREHYPKVIAVEYYFPGFDTKFSGMDWRSLWLVFEKKGSSWYLVGIVHDEWTI